MALILTSEKKGKMKNIAVALLLKQCCSIRSLTSFLGNMMPSFEAVLNTKLYYRNIEQKQIEALKSSKANFDIKIKQLSSASLSLSQIKWWHNHIMPEKLSINPIPNIDCAIYTDTSSWWYWYMGRDRMSKYFTTLMFQNY